ncbi:MAG: EutP/PduV family microcompartment system protein [Eubacteriales bacterium]|nr:EutP/PduV family microcompartment system protein [Eubacteriales bacterium]
MRKMFLGGRSEAGKTTLTQALKNEDTHYVKTQYVKTWDVTIDTPGEYSESKNHVGFALGCFSFESDVIALVCAADEPYNLFGPGIAGVCTRPVIGVITKIHSPGAHVSQAEEWLHNAGVSKIFLVDSVTGEGVDELRQYLNEEPHKISMEEAIENQNKGLKDWGAR